MDSHPGASREEAMAAIEQNYLDETWRVGRMKELMALNGSTKSEPGEPDAKENGTTSSSDNPVSPSESETRPDDEEKPVDQ